MPKTIDPTKKSPTRKTNRIFLRLHSYKLSFPHESTKPKTNSSIFLTRICTIAHNGCTMADTTANKLLQQKATYSLTQKTRFSPLCTQWLKTIDCTNAKGLTFLLYTHFLQTPHKDKVSNIPINAGQWSINCQSNCENKNSKNHSTPQNTIFPIVHQWQKPLIAQKILSRRTFPSRIQGSVQT